MSDYYWAAGVYIFTSARIFSSCSSRRHDSLAMILWYSGSILIFGDHALNEALIRWEEIVAAYLSVVKFCYSEDYLTAAPASAGKDG